MPTFDRYIGIDYSGAQTPDDSLDRLRVYMGEHSAEPAEVQPPPSRRRYWTRRGIAEWLVDRLSEDRPTIAGIDHGFSFPLRYFEFHGLPPDWPAFLDDFQLHWPTDQRNTSVELVRRGLAGNGAGREGDSRWRRLTELRAGAAKSVFHFDVKGQVAKSTHAGIPWLRFLRHRLDKRVHIWPFDGWEPAPGQSTVVEAYPSLWRHAYPDEGRTGDQHDAYTAAAWLQQADRDGRLKAAWRPALSGHDRAQAQVEGWILGVG
jgi:hypothetical protein